MNNKSSRSVFSLLHDADPYLGHPIDQFPEDIRGWWSDDATFEKVIFIQQPELIVEIGSWKGASAIHMADICKKFKLAAEIVCVDPFTGGAGTWMFDRKALMLKNGRSTLYELFLANIIRREHTDIITPFPTTSSVAADFFQRASIKPDLVYVDGSHLERDVSNDLNGFAEVMPKNGIFLCDDYKHSRIPGVTHAVEAFLQRQPDYEKIEVEPTGQATEWVAEGDTFKKYILIRRDNPLLSRLNAALAPKP